jgi:hypothetical protein
MFSLHQGMFAIMARIRTRPLTLKGQTIQLFLLGFRLKRHFLLAGFIRATLSRPWHKLHGSGHDMVLMPPLPVLRFPLAPVQAAFDQRQTAFGKIFRHGFRLAAKDDDIDVTDLVFPAFTLPHALVYRQAKRRHGNTSGCEAQVGIARQVA